MNVDITFTSSQIPGKPISMNNWTKMSCERKGMESLQCQPQNVKWSSLVGPALTL